MGIGKIVVGAVASTAMLMSMGACGGAQDASVTPTPTPSRAGVVDLAPPSTGPTDNTATEAAAKAKEAAAAAAAAATVEKAKAEAAAKAKAAAAAKTAAATKAKAAAAAKAKAAAAKAAAEAEEEAAAVSYANCTEVREAGADPIRRGDPGYSTDLDRDEDGIACE